MATKKNIITDKQKKTWEALKKTKTNVLRPHERNLIVDYSKEILNKEIKPKTHKEWDKAFNTLNKLF